MVSPDGSRSPPDAMVARAAAAAQVAVRAVATKQAAASVAVCAAQEAQRRFAVRAAVAAGAREAAEEAQRRIAVHQQHWAAHADLVRDDAEHVWLQNRGHGLTGVLAHLVPHRGSDEGELYLPAALHEGGGLKLKRDLSPQSQPESANEAKRQMLTVPSTARSPSPRSPIRQSPGARSPDAHSPGAPSPAARLAQYLDAAQHLPHQQHLAAPGALAGTASAGPAHDAVPGRKPGKAGAAGGGQGGSSGDWWCSWGKHKLVWRQRQAIDSGHFGSVYIAEEVDERKRPVAYHALKVVVFKDYKNLPKEIKDKLTPDRLRALHDELYDDSAKE